MSSNAPDSYKRVRLPRVLPLALSPEAAIRHFSEIYGVVSCMEKKEMVPLRQRGKRSLLWAWETVGDEDHLEGFLNAFDDWVEAQGI